MKKKLLYDQEVLEIKELTISLNKILQHGYS